MRTPRAAALYLVAAMIAAGAPVRSLEPEYTARERAHWAYRPPVRPAVPAFETTQDRTWVRTPIDAFVLATLQREGLRPAPEAERRVLVRRLHFDLLGLPPEPEVIDAFVRDPAPDAYEQLVDRLLASPRYGERQAQHWLDVVRYAESEGFEYDRELVGAWRFRDYVIRSFNEDKPYDRFVTEQLAGDEIVGNASDHVDRGEHELLVAAGFHRLGPVRRNAGNQEVASSRNEVLTERTDIVGTAFLGLSVGCARCHDHKFDAIRQKDYYRLQAFLAATHEHDIPLAEPDVIARHEERVRLLEEEIARLKEEMRELEGDALERKREELAEIERRMPASLPAICGIRNDAGERTPIHVLDRGEWEKKGERVGMRPLGVLLPEGAAESPADTERPRSRLARWITREENPLTARVIVNRLWQHHFGRGIVETSNDFGLNGTPPTHPELLDYLAAELVRAGWRLKPLHRLLVTSSAYRQGRRPANPATLERDPDNRLLARLERRRLSAEEIRDAMLALSGTLAGELFGPRVVVPVDAQLVELLYDPSQWSVTPDGRQHHRRSIYLFAKRNLRMPFLEAFDQPALQTSCGRRTTSTHAPQALELLNGRLSNELAAPFAARLRREAGASPARQVDRAYLLALGRAPTARELALAVEFLRAEPLEELALAVFNLDGFIYVD